MRTIGIEEPNAVSMLANHGERGGILDSGLVQAILEGVPDGVLLVSRDGLVLRANQAAATILETNPATLHGRKIQEILVNAPLSSAFFTDVLTRWAEVTCNHRIDGRNLLISAKPLAVPGS